MMCKIEGCLHKRSRRGLLEYETNSWGKWQLCPCCAEEFMDYVTSQKPCVWRLNERKN